MKKIYNILMAAAIALGTFTSCEDVPMPFNNPLDYLEPDPETIVIEPAGDGTKDSPFNVAGVLAYLEELGPDVESTKDIYVTGVVTAVKEQFSTQYGNAQFVISDNDEGSNQFTFYRGLYLGNKKYSNENDVNIQEEDVVVICGKIVNYRGSTPETVQNKAYVVSINGKGVEVPETTTAEAKGAGTQTDPYNVAGVLNYLNTLGADVTSSNEVYIKGKVKEITEQFGTQYGNATFTMIDEGYDAIFTAYRILYLGNKKYTEGDLLKEGDEVIVCGKVVNFRGNTPETSQNTAYLYSLNGKTADGGGGGTSEVKTVSIADFNAAPVSDTWYQLTGTVKNLKDGDQYGNFDLEDATGSVYVYGLLSEKGGEKKMFQDLVAAKGIKEGSKITIIGNRGEYNGKIEVLNAYFVSIEGGGGGSTEGVQTVSIADFNAAAVSNDIWYQLTGTVKNLKDGDQYGNFDLEDNTGSVYVYGLLSEKGGEKKNFQDRVAAKGIKENSKITIIGNRGEYNGKIEVLNAYFVSIEGGGGNGGGNGGGGSTTTTLTNGNFETWADGLPTGWKSASSASNATLSQSTDAHGGSYSVNVNGNESSNKRLASQEITLTAGTYTFSFYVKATTSDAAQARPGYVPVTDGTAGSYTYGDYANLTTNWTQVSYEFTLDADATVCLVVMNPKKSNYSSGKDILVDDATLTKK
jgi:RPA family protein